MLKNKNGKWRIWGISISLIVIMVLTLVSFKAEAAQGGAITIEDSQMPDINALTLNSEGDNLSFKYNGNEFLVLQPRVATPKYTTKGNETTKAYTETTISKASGVKTSYWNKQIDEKMHFALNISNLQDTTAAKDYGNVGLKVVKGWENMSISQGEGGIEAAFPNGLNVVSFTWST